VKFIKPQKLGLLTRTFENAGKSYLVLSALGFFPFHAPRKLLHEVTMWKAATDQLGQDVVLDAAMSKHRGEVLVTGKACAKDGKPVTAVRAGVKIGGVDKHLYVIGDRLWGAAGPSDPVPFAEMPITWENAFGGAGFAKNPLGKGVAPIDVAGKKVHPLPNVEDPAHIVKSVGDRPEPACFGAIDQTWPQRMALVGTYDQEWLDTLFPGFAKDFQWEFFNVAPADQRIAGQFRGDEDFEVEGMHPRERVLKGRLPGITARFFVVQQTEAGDAFREAVARLDTVHLFPNIERGIVIFRAMLPIAEDDGHDVKHVIAAFEDPAAPRPIEHYQGVLAKRLDKSRGALMLLLDRDLMPWDDPDDAVPEDRWNDMDEIVEAEHLGVARANARLDREIAAARAKVVELGLDPKEFDAKLPERPGPPPKDPQKLVEYLERMEVLAHKENDAAKARQAELMDRARRECEALGLDFDALVAKEKRRKVGPTAFSADGELERMRDLSTLGQNAGADTSQVDALLADPAFEAKLRKAESAQVDGYRRFVHLMPKPDPVLREEAAALRQQVEEALEKGVSLAGRDLSGADLSGMSFEGADLTGALMESARLRGTRFTRAKLGNAVLARAHLEEADLEGADLRGANLGHALLQGASLRGADLSRAVLDQADLRRADLSGASVAGAQLLGIDITEANFSDARVRGAVFHEADLSDVRFVRADVAEATFMKCTLDRASFAGADLTKANFVESEGDAVSFFEAKMERAVFALGTRLPRADFRAAKLLHTGLRDTSFVEADFSGATADDCDFSGADLSQAKLYRLHAERSLFVRTKLARADVRAAVLMYAVLQKAELHGADLRGANLFRADLSKVRGDKETRFDDAYLVQIRVVPEQGKRVVPVAAKGKPMS
jgi:uncharacterized protein YjbI with pentapeptide repeats